MAGKTNKLNSASKHSTFIDNDDSDSDSSSNESFLAVPEQFRPNATTRKSPVQKKPILESKLIENKVSNNPTVSKPSSYPGQLVKVPVQKNTVPDNIQPSSVEHDKSCFSGKSLLPETTLLPKGKESPKETEQTGNKPILEVIDEPIKCRTTRRTLKMSETADKPRAPVHQNRQKPRNTPEPSREVEETTNSEANENKIVENKGKYDRISVPTSSSSVIELDVASIRPVNEKKRNSNNKLKYENVLEKANRNYSANTKHSPVSYKYTKKNRRSQPRQISFSIRKQECIRWNSDLNLNVLNQDPHPFTTQMIDNMRQKSNKIECTVVGKEKAVDDKIEWSVVREEKTFISPRKLEDSNMNNCRQIENEKTASKLLFKVTAKSLVDDTNTPFPTNRIERNESKTVPKATIRRNDGGKKTNETRTIFYKNNLKEKKNVLMNIKASSTCNSGNSENCEKSCNEVEYDCCKKYTTCNEDKLSDENHCYLCEISEPSNGMNGSNRGQRHDQLINENFLEENQRHQNLPSSKRDSFPRIRKTKPIGMTVNNRNDFQKFENLPESCRKKDCENCEQHATSDDDVLGKESFYDKREISRSSKSCQQLTRDQLRNANWLQENIRRQNLHTDNQDSFFRKEKSKDVKSDYCEASEENRNSVLQFGREISDLVIGCHIALSTFFPIYNEWSRLRRGLIEQFEQLEENIRDSSEKYTKYSDVLKVVDAGATMASAIPHTYVSVAAKIVTIISRLMSKFINTSKSRTTDVEEPEIIPSLLQDIDLSSELYMHGLQCNQQFEETTKFVEEFLSSISFCEFCVSEDVAMTNFIQGVLDYTPKYHIFYKKLHKCFQELIQKCSSSFSRRFCEPFQLYGLDAVDVIGHLDWRFTQDFSNESVRHELEEITRLIQNKSTSMKDLLSEIKKCIAILRNEVSHVERCVSKVSMFDNSYENFKLNSKQ